MAISEACQMWIEQRIEEELQEKNESGKSLRVIGREIAKEIERLFEAKVNPMTLTMKASRMQGVTNVTPQVTPQEHTESEENQVEHGGRREGAGRKPKYSFDPERCIGVPLEVSPERLVEIHEKIRRSGTVTIEAKDIKWSATRIRIAFTDNQILQLIMELQQILKTEPEVTS